MRTAVEPVHGRALDAVKFSVDAARRRDVTTFGTLLRSMRLSAGLTLEELAEKSGISVRTIGYIESGRTQAPYQRTVQLLADSLRLEGAARSQFQSAARADRRPIKPEFSTGLAAHTTPEDGGDEADAAETTFPAPAQLPHDVPGFVGREAELGTMTKLQQSGQVFVLTAIDGSPGVGKTALAVHWAHQAAEQFPDGQLYINLHGFSQSAEQVTPAAAVRGFLAAFGISPERIPADSEAQTSLYRSLLAGKRMLILLDNARDENQVRPLLPGNPACVVVITSRRQLVGLIAADGARSVPLDLLSESEARELLVRRMGAERVVAEPEATAQLIRLCARLPLALSVVAARAVVCPALPLKEMADELRLSSDRLKALDVTDTATSVRTAFSWSYRHLNPDSSRLFRLLGLHPGQDIDIYAAANLAGIPLRQARGLLRELVHANLLSMPFPGRFGFHDLLRTYAAELAQAHESDSARRAALGRLFDYYLAMASAAMDSLVPAERNRRPRPPTSAGPASALGTAAEARAFLDAERACLVAVTAYAAAGDWASHATRLSATLYRYLDNGGYHSDAVAVHTHALHAARRSGDRPGEADALRCLGAVAWWQGRYDESGNYVTQALDLYRDLGDRLGEARALHNLALTIERQGCYEESVAHHRSALAILGELGDRLGAARSLDHLGVMLCRLGRYAESADHHWQSLRAFRELGDEVAEAGAMSNLGVALRCQGHYAEAASHQQQALNRFRQLGHRDAEAETLNNLGQTLREQSRYEEAIDHHRRALEVYRELDSPAGQACSLNGLGEALSACGEVRQARAFHHEALGLAREIGELREQARAHEAIARGCHTDGNFGRARHHWQCSLVIYTRLNVPEADQVLAALQNAALSEERETDPTGTPHRLPEQD